MAAFGGEKCWAVVEIGNSGSQLLLKTFFDERNCCYKIALFDGLSFWQEIVTTEQFKTKCKEFNPKVEADPVYLLQELKQNCENNEKERGNVVLKKIGGMEEQCELSIKFKLQAGVPFVWKFRLSKGSEEAVSSQLILPMLSMLCEFQRRQSELLKIIERKDIEIQDYKEQGVSPSKKNIETCGFDVKSFKKDSVSAKAISSAASRPLSAFSDAGCKILYEEIVKQSSRSQKTMQGVFSGDDVMETQIHGTQLNEDNEEENNTQVHLSSKSSESAKVNILVNEELKRRGQIEKRLAEDREKDSKSQKKSRKINL